MKEGVRLCRILTIHNNPDNLKPPSKIKHLKIELADVETEDVSRFFNDSYTFIEEARTAKEGELQRLKETTVAVECSPPVQSSSTDLWLLLHLAYMQSSGPCK